MRDSVFDPNQRLSEAKVHVREKDGKQYCQVWIYLEGSDLPFVDQVTYVLHEDIKPSVQTVERTPSNANCALAIWTPGPFLAKARILDKKGVSYQVDHSLIYQNQFPTDPQKYEYEEGYPDTDARPMLASY